MFNASEGILTVHEMNDIRDAHLGPVDKVDSQISASVIQDCL